MTIRVRRRMFALEVSDISWIQGASQYSRVHTKNGEYLLSRTLAYSNASLTPALLPHPPFRDRECGARA
jgi:DNA-binding LytR/AlgR family response regulator